ncbi:DUF6635 family protein [Pseudobdellovibrio sp. HCB154]|uniref:DUF6635 family protein n=1 Tax=Pseudobdellovibrio sp. HCB154 TaxID=3386277 RepID=UPI00391756DD
MEERSLAPVLGALDECIEKYCEDRKKRVDGFIERHFSTQETIDIQKKSFHLDLLFNPLNALWSIPYLTLKKSIEILDKLGWTKLTPIMEKIPSGIKTGYQKEVEKLIAKELLDYEALILEFHNHPTINKLITTKELTLNEIKIKNEINKEVDKYSSSQAMITDLSGTVMTLLMGWYFFGDKTLGVFGMGNRIARKIAHDKAASGFVFGEKLGSAFYNVFPPMPTQTQVYMATLGVGILLTAFSVLAAIMSDPLRKRFGLHKKNFNNLIENLEEKLFLQLKKEVKTSLRKANQNTRQQIQAS